MTFRTYVVAVGLAGLAASACLFGQSAFGPRRETHKAAAAAQDDDKKDKEKKGKDAKDKDVIFYGVSSCNNKGCHGGSPPETWIKDENGKQRDLLSRCNEADLFAKKDKHGDAYKVLVDEGGQGLKMEEVLKKTAYADEVAKKTRKPYTVATDPNCLACHAVVVSDPAVLKASIAIGYDVKDGVSCSACHGARSEWIANHALMVSAVKFRPLSRKEKEDKYGLIDLRDPVRRTELCASCHVGSVKENKFVTHEMYAAGHPPLPGFEVATFSNEEPRHWQLMRDKSESIQKELGFKGESEETAFVLIGGAIAFRESMNLLNDQAAKAIKDGQKLDLSNYDCWSCHHPLEQKWRQDKEWTQGRKLGSTPMRDWSAEIVRLSIAYLEMKGEKDKGAMRKDFEGKLKTLTDAFNEGRGGNAEKIRDASAALRDWSKTLADEIATIPPQQKDLRPLLEEFPKLYDGRLLGYDAGREVAWAAEVILNEMNGGKANSGDDEYKTPLPEAAKWVKLRLPKGRGSKVVESLNDNMKSIEAYNPFEFRPKFSAELKALLKMQ